MLNRSVGRATSGILNFTYVMMDQQMEANLPPARLETRITAQRRQTSENANGEIFEFRLIEREQ